MDIREFAYVCLGTASVWAQLLFGYGSAILPANRQRPAGHPAGQVSTLKPVALPESLTAPVARVVGIADSMDAAVDAPKTAQPPHLGVVHPNINAQAESPLVVDLLQFLMARPTFDEIAQHVVLSLTPKYGTKAALLGECQVDGSLRHLGAFGVSPSRAIPLTAVSLWDSSPLSDAIRSGRPVVCPQPGEAAQRYPHLTVLREIADPTGAWPLALPSQLVGGMQLFFHAPIEGPDVHQDVSGVGALLALYLSLLRTSSGGSNGGAVETGTPAAAIPPPPSRHMTERQRSILAHIAHGRTNIQIAHTLGFSESTIRQETIAIYRALGVHDRREAVRQARAQGILQD